MGSQQPKEIEIKGISKKIFRKKDYVKKIHDDVESLSLYDEKLTEIDLSPLRHCTQLQKLDLSINQLKKIDLSPLQHCTQLQKLNLIWNQLKEIDLSPLQHCPHLQTLDLRNNQKDLQLIALEPLQSAPWPAVIQRLHGKIRWKRLDSYFNTQEAAKIISEAGKITYDTLNKQLKIPVETNILFKSIILESGIRGILTKDGRFFLANEFILNNLNGQKIAKVFQVSVNHVEEILNHLENILVGDLERIKEIITKNLSTKNQVDLTPLAKELHLHVEDLIPLLSGDPRIIIWKYFSVNKTRVAQVISKEISKAGKIEYESIINLQITGVTSSVFKSIILESGISGVLTSDGKYFLTNEFIQKQLEDQIRIFTDISFEEISNILQIPVNSVEEILIDALKVNIIVGKIDRSAKRLQTKEKAIPVVTTAVSKREIKDEYQVGSVFTVQRLIEEFNCTEAQVVGKIKEGLPNKSLFVTRKEDVIKIEALQFNCQLYCESSDNKYFQCKPPGCERYVCWIHFEELSSVGRPLCPNCGGELELLPKYCEKCSIDYLTVSSKEDYCEFCGYRLSYAQEVQMFAKKAQEVLTTKKREPPSQLETFTPKKGM